VASRRRFSGNDNASLEKLTEPVFYFKKQAFSGSHKELEEK
jgi:hypothetical protein